MQVASLDQGLQTQMPVGLQAANVNEEIGLGTTQLRVMGLQGTAKCLSPPKGAVVLLMCLS